MATEQLGFSIGTETADGDYTSSQFLGVKFSATGFAVCSAAGEACDGILQDKPALGSAGKVTVLGKSKAVAGAAFAKGALLAVNASGKLITAVSGNYIVGRALEAASGADEIVSVVLTRFGRVA